MSETPTVTMSDGEWTVEPGYYRNGVLVEPKEATE